MDATFRGAFSKRNRVFAAAKRNNVGKSTCDRRDATPPIRDSPKPVARQSTVVCNRQRDFLVRGVRAMIGTVAPAVPIAAGEQRLNYAQLVQSFQFGFYPIGAFLAVENVQPRRSGWSALSCVITKAGLSPRAMASAMLMM